MRFVIGSVHSVNVTIIIIIIFINCKWVDTHPTTVVNLHITYVRTVKVDYCRFSWGGLHGKQVVAAGKGTMGTIPAFALGPRKTKKNLCRDGRKSVSMQCACKG
jgi:hypothetical protein